MFGGNMQGMMKKVQKMQKEMKKLQDDLKKRTVEAKNVESVHIDPSIIDPEDSEMLEDLIVAAVNEANKKVDEMMAQEMSKITGGMHLPGMF